MESAINHPCQSLADWKTLDDLGIPDRNSKFVLSWSWHPQPMPLAVPAATVHMAALRGMDVTVLRPQGYELPDTIMVRARDAAALSGGSVTETDSRQDAMEDAQVLYVNSWASQQHYGDARAEEDFKHELRNWCVDEPWFSNAADDCRFMHALPVRREVTVTERILDGTRSVVIAEARNRMLVQMAVLHRMLSDSGN
jgi:N-acetylornithine carbamoyltransferase